MHVFVQPACILCMYYYTLNPIRTIDSYIIIIYNLLQFLYILDYSSKQQVFMHPPTHAL